MNKGISFWCALWAVFLTACSGTLYQPAQVNYGQYGVEGKLTDTVMLRLVKPYSDSVNKTMDEVLGTLGETLEKKGPHNPLGNFMTDAFLERARQVYGKPVDLAFVNTGGIRINSLQAGPVRLRNIFELMPFDNLLVLLQMNGDTLLRFLNHIVGRGGWPISGGQYSMNQSGVTDVRINGQPLVASALYTVALSDYIANGGDNCTMLLNLNQENKGYLQRDAIVEFIRAFQQRGEPIKPANEVRVTRSQ
jgi:2',3'-cyclic-nucleotide 2'-phosphodiesterase (5'-nucleotidase family)